MNTRLWHLKHDYNELLKLHSKAVFQGQWAAYNDAQKVYNETYTEYERNIVLPNLLKGK